MSTISFKAGLSKGDLGTGDLLFADDLPEYAEYDYGPDPDHMTEGEAAERYKVLKAALPEAIISLEELPCGHYAVSVYQSEDQKQSFYRRAYNGLVRRAVDKLFGTA